jgi:putative FmdB family regulatory protein
VPLYDYVCEACRHRFEVIHGVHDHGPTTCPNCGKGPVRKAITTAAIHYKGSGWAKKERRASAAGRSKSDGDGGTTETGSEPAAATSDSGDTADAAEKADKADRKRSDQGRTNKGRESSPTAATPAPDTD